MWLTAQVLRWCLGLCLLGMLLIGAFYLRSRRLDMLAYLGWGLLLFIPLGGPFLLILAHPGEAS